jgi:transcriptional regulator with XRE-family HTH domain
MSAQDSESDSPKLLPEQRMGAALRAARESGGLTLRQMAKRLRYGSHSSLSEYENGVRMPSESVVEGYERVLGLEAGKLHSIFESANIERHGDAWSKRKLHLPMDFTVTPSRIVKDGKADMDSFISWRLKFLIGAFVLLSLSATGIFALVLVFQDRLELYDTASTSSNSGGSARWQ